MYLYFVFPQKVLLNLIRAIINRRVSYITGSYNLRHKNMALLNTWTSWASALMNRVVEWTQKITLMWVSHWFPKKVIWAPDVPKDLVSFLQAKKSCDIMMPSFLSGLWLIRCLCKEGKIICKKKRRRKGVSTNPATCIIGSVNSCLHSEIELYLSLTKGKIYSLFCRSGCFLLRQLLYPFYQQNPLTHAAC